MRIAYSISIEGVHVDSGVGIKRSLLHPLLYSLVFLFGLVEFVPTTAYKAIRRLHFLASLKVEENDNNKI